MEQRKRILIVDDDPEMVDFLTMLVEQGGFESRSATNGRDALQKALAEPVDLILLDVMLPYVDGYRVAHQLTGTLGPKAPRIIIMTARSMEPEKEMAATRANGAQDFILKPFTPEEMLARIRKVLAA
jgi:DNA-binding response OmpR family regulator